MSRATFKKLETELVKKSVYFLKLNKVIETREKLNEGVGARHHNDRAVNINPLSTVDQSLLLNRPARVRSCASALFCSFNPLTQYWPQYRSIILLDIINIAHVMYYINNPLLTIVNAYVNNPLWIFLLP